MSKIVLFKNEDKENWIRKIPEKWSESYAKYFKELFSKTKSVDDKKMLFEKREESWITQIKTRVHLRDLRIRNFWYFNFK